jgi:hypothetical protein
MVLLLVVVAINNYPLLSVLHLVPTTIIPLFVTLEYRSSAVQIKQKNVHT